MKDKKKKNHQIVGMNNFLGFIRRKIEIEDLNIMTWSHD